VTCQHLLAHSKPAYHGVGKIDEQSGSQHNQQAYESDIHSFTRSGPILCAIDFECGLAETDFAKNQRRAAQQRELPRAPRTDPYVHLYAYGSYLGCLTAKRWLGQG
jgi:hypothetical protein